jgi:hypothetical protein
MQVLIFVWYFPATKAQASSGAFCVCIAATNLFGLVMSVIGSRTCRDVRVESAFGCKPDLTFATADF